MKKLIIDCFNIDVYDLDKQEKKILVRTFLDYLETGEFIEKERISELSNVFKSLIHYMEFNKIIMNSSPFFWTEFKKIYKENSESLLIKVLENLIIFTIDTFINSLPDGYKYNIRNPGKTNLYFPLMGIIVPCSSNEHISFAKKNNCFKIYRNNKEINAYKITEKTDLNFYSIACTPFLTRVLGEKKYFINDIHYNYNKNLRNTIISVTEGMNILKKIDPDSYTDIANEINLIVPINHGVEDGRHELRSFTDEALPQTIFMCSPDEPVFTAELLIHEFHHNELNLLLRHKKLFSSASENAILYSPLRNDPRPLLGFFHALYVMHGIVNFYITCYENKVKTSLIKTMLLKSLYQLEIYHHQLDDKFFTPDGRNFKSKLNKQLDIFFEKVSKFNFKNISIPKSIVEHIKLWELKNQLKADIPEYIDDEILKSIGYRITNFKAFIEAWSDPRNENNRKPIHLRTSQIGNINNTGDPNDNSADMLTVWHPDFEKVIEKEIKALVLFLTKELGWISFSSCQGHFHNGELRHRHVELIGRDENEYEKIRKILLPSADKINQTYKQSLCVSIHDFYIVDRFEQFHAIRLSFSPQSKEKRQEYFQDINKATDDFLNILRSI